MDYLTLSISFLDKNEDTFLLEDINRLQKLIEYHSHLYYNKEEPIISDRDYDSLFQKLVYLEQKFNIKNKQSLKVWAEIGESTFEKVKHSRSMISLDNTYNEEDLRNFDERVYKNIKNSLVDRNEKEMINYTVEFKFDGLGVELIYDNWKLLQAITRWNWIEGEDVTVNVMQIENIPKSITYTDYLEVRGEVVMPISVFNDINEKAKVEGTKIFSNPRNSASWSLRMKNAKVTKERKLKFFAYDLANLEEFKINEKIENYFNIIKNLEKLWFDISSYFEICNTINDVIYKIENFTDIKNKIDFEIDGLVVKVNDIDLWEKIGFTEHHPKYAISYKFPAEVFTTKILSVEHQVWRTWTITPVANLDGVNMWGAVIKRATLHNYEEVENLWVKIGDTVFIKRAWEVIPKIISVSVSNNWENILAPKFCPSCETEVKKDEDKVRYYCPNEIDCPAKHHEKLTFAIGKQWFNIDWFWEKQVELFLKHGIIHNIVDIFKISDKRDEILKLEWFQEKSVDNLIKSIKKSKNVKISVFLTALWISWVWKKTSKILSKLFKNKKNLLDFNSNLEELEKLEDIWPEIAKNVINYFNNESHKRILSELIEILNIEYYVLFNIVNKDNYFYWKKVCITWSFEQNWIKIWRDDLIKQLEKNWGEFIWSVSKNLDYLLAWNKAWGKLEKASKLGIKIIDLEEFIKKIK